MFDPHAREHGHVYVFHGTESTQVLGPEHLMGQVRTLLSAAGTDPAPEPSLHPDIVPRPYTSESQQDPGDPAPEHWTDVRSTVTEVSVDLGADAFWDRVDKGSWATWQDRWPDPPGGPLFPPSAPDWLVRAPRWELDPLAPALGPAASGGWVRSPARAGGSGEPAVPRDPSDRPGDPARPEPGGTGVGLFQLTDLESFWVFAPEADVADIMARCEALATDHPAFTWLTGYFDVRDVAGSLRLPSPCLPILEADLASAGYAVDTWW